MTSAQVMPIRAMNILLIEDNESDVFLVENTLDVLCPNEFNLTAAASTEEALQMLSQPFDVAILDWSLPGSSGLEALKVLSHAAPKLAIIVLTGNNDEGTALVSLKHGAQDYLVKERADGITIRRAIRYAIERKQFESSLITMANYDPLTGLANRTLFESRLDMALARGRRSSEPVGVLFLDLNGFKQVNDSLGHEAGDGLLKSVGARLVQTLRECDTVARFGGDEFAVLVEGATNPRNYAVVAQKIIDALAPPFTLGLNDIEISVSIGIAIGTPNTQGEELMKQADEAMYSAKEHSTSNYQFHTGTLNTETLDRMQMEHELAVSIRRKSGLCLLYQPKLDMASGALVGAEALLRWDHPKRGMLAPADFMHLLLPALATELDQWMLETICRDIQCWQTAGLKPTQVSVHISNQRWENAGTATALMDAIKHAGLRVQCMGIKVDELALVHYGNEGFDVLSRVRETGIDLQLDSALSSLKLITHCPLDAVKIDRRLTANMDSNAQHAVLVKALVGLGERLGTKAMIDGAATEEEQQLLKSMNSEEMQGTVISKPLPAPEFFHWLGSRSRAAS